MKKIFEIAVVSGKGGVGKTTVSASLAYYLFSRGFRIVASDADVDTPSLKLLIPLKEVYRREDIAVSKKAVINRDKCVKCGRCAEECVYDAIIRAESSEFKVLPYMCEGCGVCRLVCPVDAIEILNIKTGELLVGDTIYGFPMVTAQLEVGEHNSGLLVGAVRNEASKIVENVNARIIVTDGAPGIGCPVIATLIGASYAIVVVEPTPPSLKGALRVIEVAKHFQVPVGLIINKYDISSYTSKIEELMLSKYSDISVLGKIPLDFEVLKAVAQRKPIIEFNSSANASIALIDAFEKLLERVEI